MFKNLSFRTKLGLVIAPPLIILMIFALVVVKPRLNAAAQASGARDTAELSLRSMVVVDELANERGLSAWILAGNTSEAPALLSEARTKVDGATKDLAAFATANSTLSDEATTKSALSGIDKLTTLRQQIDAGSLAPQDAYKSYTDTLSTFINLAGRVGTDTTQVDLVRQGSAAFSYLLVKDQFAQMRDNYVYRFEAASFAQTDLDGIIQLRSQKALYQADFERNGDPALRTRFKSIAGSAQAATADDIIDQAVAAARTGRQPTFTASDWWTSLTGVMDAFNTVDDANFETFVKASADLASKERTAALEYAALAVVAVIAASASALLLSRSLVRRLRSISSQAQTVAVDRLPEVLEALRNPTREALAEALPQVNSDARDEIGSLADSFNAVLRTAVETGLDHAQQRARTVTNMLVNLGRRNQALIDRQLQIMDRLEARHDDPELLEGLFEIDHMVTRMRRNAENLLVLAGQQQARSWTEPVPMEQVLQGAASESPDMARIEIQVPDADNLELSGLYAVDVSHLLAELVENATAYSSPATQVVLRTERNSNGQFRVWVVDNGVGMSEDDLAESNERLASPPDIDTIVTDRVGFQVIGRMAQKLGIEVTLKANPTGGVAALVALPNRLFEGAEDQSASSSGAGATKKNDRDDSVFRRVEAGRDRRDERTGEDRETLLSDDELSGLHDEPTPSAASGAPAGSAPAPDGLVKRTPGAAYVGNAKAAAADAGEFRRLPEVVSEKPDEEAAFGRFKAMSALQSAVLQGREESEDETTADPEEQS